MEDDLVRINLIKFLPMIYTKITKPMSRYEILKKIGLPPNMQQNYKKIDEWIELGILRRDDDSIDKFVADKKRIWEIFKGSVFGKDFIDMIQDRQIFPVD